MTMEAIDKYLTLRGIKHERNGDDIYLIGESVNGWYNVIIQCVEGPDVRLEIGVDVVSYLPLESAVDFIKGLAT